MCVSVHVRTFACARACALGCALGCVYPMCVCVCGCVRACVCVCVSRKHGAAGQGRVCAPLLTCSFQSAAQQCTAVLLLQSAQSIFPINLASTPFCIRCTTTAVLRQLLFTPHDTTTVPCECRDTGIVVLSISGFCTYRYDVRL